MSMGRAILAFGLILFFAPARGDDGADNPDSSLSKTSNDQRVKVTLLYIGPIQNPSPHLQFPFVVTYLLEDNRTDEELKRHPWNLTNAPVDTNYYLASGWPELKDGTHPLVDCYGERRGWTYREAEDPQRSNFQAIYPHVTLPVPLHPERAMINEFYYKQVFQGPYDLLLQDSIPAYERNNFHFRDIEASAFSSH